MPVPLLPYQLDGAELAVEVAWGADPNLVDTSSWVWSDITEDVRFSSPIGITLGRGDEASDSQPAKCTLTLDNSFGAYSLGPQSPNYPNVRRNTPMRVRVLGVARGLFIDGSRDLRGSYASAADTAALDITGDIDIRVDIEPTYPRFTEPIFETIASKYDITGDQRSWSVLRHGNGDIEFNWSPDGTFTNRLVAISTEPIPVDTGRVAVRVTLDVDGGDGLHYVRFWTGPSVDGPWTQLGLGVAAIGITSIYAGTADLWVGDIGGFNADSAATFNGAIHRVQVRDGIGGTIVADADFDTAPPGSVSFTDSADLQWTVSGEAMVSAVPLFVGYATGWAPSWDLTGRIPTVSLTAAGTLRRLKQRSKPTQSTLFRKLSTLPEAVAHWPMEEGPNATHFKSGRPNDGSILTFDGDVTLADFDGYDGSAAIPTVGVGAIRGSVPPFTPDPDQRFLCLVHVPEQGIGTPHRVLQRVWTSSGAVRRWDTRMETVNGQDGVEVAGFDAEGVELFSSGALTEVSGIALMISLWLVQNGSNTDWQSAHFYPDGTATVHSGSYATTYGRITAVQMGDGVASVNGTAFGHAAVLNGNTQVVWNVLSDGMLAWTGEPAAHRISRVSHENSVPLLTHGGSSLTMGPQGLDTVLQLIRDGETADQGVLLDGVGPGLSYVARELRENIGPALVIDAQQYHLSPGFAPTDDDQRTVNSVTAKQKDGSQATVSDEASIAAIGLYDASETINTDDASMLDQYASWLLHLGTSDGYRYPSITVDVRATPGLAAQALALRPSARIDVTGLGQTLTGHPADTVSLLVEGLSHSISPLQWTVTAQSSPYGPWRIIRLAADTGDTDPYLAHLDTDGAELAAAATQGDTTLSVATLSGPLWTTDTDDVPFEIEVAGWPVTVTAITGATSPQMFTVDPLPADLPVGAAVSVHNPPVLGL